MQFQRPYLRFGAPNPKDVCPTETDNDQCENGACKPEIKIASEKNKISV